MTPYLGEMVTLFLVSVLIAYASYRIRLVPIAGFLLAGVLIGPGALALLPDVGLVYSLAEIGVILLLFTIGAEFSLAKLARIKMFILVGGGLQATAMVGVVTLILTLFGVPWRLGVFTGFLVVLSSTAIVLKLLSDRRQTDTPAGQVSLALLIFQDLAMVFMVLLVPVLSGGGGSFFEVVLVLGKAAFVIGLILLLARRAIPWLLEKIAQTRREELFLLTVVAVCFGTAWVTSLFGVSLALGAFLAGLVVSESRYGGYALSEILPLRTVFNAIFFVSIGMLLDAGFLVEHFFLVLVVGGSVLLLKAVVTAGTVLALGYPVRIAAISGLALAQICESSFVLERAGALAGLSPAGLGAEGQQLFIAVAVLLMVLTPFLVEAGPRVGAWLERTPLGGRGSVAGLQHRPSERLENHVIVIGFGPTGRRLVEVLRGAGISFVIVELNPQSVKELEAEGLPFVYGDASRIHILELVGVERAKQCVVVINDAQATHNITSLAHFLNPTLQIIVRARFISEVEPLTEAGADVVVSEELETSGRVLRHVLGGFLVPASEIERQVEALQAGALGGHVQERVLGGLDEEGLLTRVVRVRSETLAAGRTLGELALRRLFGLTVLAVRRGAETIGNPDGDFRVEQGDRLVLMGRADQFAAGAHLFRKTTPATPKGASPPPQ